MDYTQYQEAYFANPQPEPRFHFCSSFGITLFYESYNQAVAFYTQVLGIPAYAEGTGTRGWQIGTGWLTLLHSKSGNPRNVEITLELATPSQAEKLQQAFIDAGGTGAPPSDQLMYVPIRSCPVVDPFGTEILIISKLACYGGQTV
ncbi:MAG: hypothetical protein E4H27_05600 [Anaerolineales bacterium]|nr:MAG: hypothetical protein E4H27_05600 [Anaerolineales bacterium]